MKPFQSFAKTKSLYIDPIWSNCILRGINTARPIGGMVGISHIAAILFAHRKEVI